MLSKLLDKLFRTLHRILGTLLSILFLMWFLTGIVMIYHRFPSASQEEKLSKMQPIQCNLPSLDSIAVRNGIAIDSIKSAALYRYLNQSYYELGIGRRSTVNLLADSSEFRVVDDSQRILNVAKLWCEAPVEKIDSLYSLEQWIPFGRLKEDFPIYKFYFSDKERTQLYISSKTSEVLQCTTRSERIWAWLGAIPHWVYLTWIRQDAETWKSLIIWLSIFGIIMLVSGCWMGVRSFRHSVKQGRGFTSPYKKKWYRWHHILGSVFGIFLLTWIVSGMYSLAQIPQWLGKEHNKYNFRSAFDTGKLPSDKYILSVDSLLAYHRGQISRIEWKSFAGHPFYKIQLADGETACIDALSSNCAKLAIDSSEVKSAVASVHVGEPISISLLTEYDSYYIDLKGRMPLPVWKVDVGNADKNSYYVDLHSGTVRTFNTHSRWQFQLYQGFHSLRYKVFVGRRGLWILVMWVLLLGGSAASFTGVVLGVRYVARCFRKKKPKRQS